jgi:hypothetical protein
VAVYGNWPKALPFEGLILDLAEKRLKKYLARRGEGILRQLIAEETLAKTQIAIDPDAAKGMIIFCELPVTSLVMVPGVGVEPTQARGPRDFKSLASTVSATPASGGTR